MVIKRTVLSAEPGQWAPPPPPEALHVEWVIDPYTQQKVVGQVRHAGFPFEAALPSEPGDSYVFVNDSNAVDSHAHSNMMMMELDGILNRLDVLYRKPFTLFVEGYKYEEIAESMHLPIGTVKSRIFFARQKLMDTIRQQYNYDTTLN